MVFYCPGCYAEPPAVDVPYTQALCGLHIPAGRRALGVTEWGLARGQCPLCGTRGFWRDRQYFECIYPQHVERLKLDRERAEGKLL